MAAAAVLLDGTVPLGKPTSDRTGPWRRGAYKYGERLGHLRKRGLTPGLRGAPPLFRRGPDPSGRHIAAPGRPTVAGRTRYVDVPELATGCRLAQRAVLAFNSPGSRESGGSPPTPYVRESQHATCATDRPRFCSGNSVLKRKARPGPGVDRWSRSRRGRPRTRHGRARSRRGRAHLGSRPVLGSRPILGRQAVLGRASLLPPLATGRLVCFGVGAPGRRGKVRPPLVRASGRNGDRTPKARVLSPFLPAPRETKCAPTTSVADLPDGGPHPGVRGAFAPLGGQSLTGRQAG
jgi:hypothetical protein